MTNELLEAIEKTLPNLEEIRERIIATEATNTNRDALDRAYATVLDALENLSALSSTAQSTVHAQ